MSDQSTTIEKVAWRDLFANGNGIKATTLALGVMLHATNVYLATTVMPSVIKDIGGLEYYAWNTTFFVVASVIGSVISANRLAVSGPRKAYQFAIVLFSLGTLICTMAPAMYVLLLGRFIQGFGGGLLFALSYAMIRIVFEKSLWARAMALVSGMWGIAAFSGPFLGGVFAEHGHWRMAFGFLLVVCAIIFVITSVILPSQKGNHEVPPLPYVKLAMLVLAAVSVSVGSILGSIAGNLMGVILAIFFLFILVLMENKGSIRLLPTGAYKLSSSLSATYIVMALLSMTTCIEIYVPYFAQVINGFSPLESGYLTVLLAFGWTFSSITFSGVKGRRVNRVILIGAITMFLSLLGLTCISLQHMGSTTSQLVLNCVLLFGVGAGIGMGWPHLLTKVFSLAPSGEEELTSASVTTVQLMATTFGAALAGLVSNAGGITVPGGATGAQEAATWLYGIFALAPLVATLVMIFTDRKRRAVKQ